MLAARVGSVGSLGLFVAWTTVRIVGGVSDMLSMCILWKSPGFPLKEKNHHPRKKAGFETEDLTQSTHQPTCGTLLDSTDWSTKVITRRPVNTWTLLPKRK